MSKELLRKSLQHEAQSIAKLADDLNFEQISRVIELLNNTSGKIVFSGCGTSGIAARKIAHTLNCIEIPSIFMSPSDASHGGLGVIRDNDIVILISRGGETSELNELIPKITSRGCTILAVTETPSSYLSRKSDFQLTLPPSVEVDRNKVLATTSILNTIAVFDGIINILSEKKGFSLKEFSQIHPGGKVGKQIKAKGEE